MTDLAKTINPCMWSGYLGVLSPADAVCCFADNDFRHLELSSEHAMTLLECGAGSYFAAVCNSEGVSVNQGHLNLEANITYPDSKERHKELELLKRNIELFQACGITHGVLHPGRNYDLWDSPDAPGQIAQLRHESLSVLADFIRGSDFVICLENTRMADSKYAGELIAMYKDFKPENFGVCFDTGHYNLVADDFDKFIICCGDNLKALHIADNMGTDDDHLAPYMGTVDWGRVLDGLKQVGFSGDFNLEIPGESKHCPLELRIKKLQYYRELCDYMLKK